MELAKLNGMHHIIPANNNMKLNHMQLFYILEFAMPPIGIMSNQKRVKAFITIQNFANGMIERGLTDVPTAVDAMKRLMAVSPDFMKAVNGTAHNRDKLTVLDLWDVGLVFLEWYCTHPDRR